MKKQLVFIQFLVLVIFTACQNTNSNKITKHGFEYKIIDGKGKGNPVKAGDKILYYQSVYKNDTLIQSTVNIEIIPDEASFPKVPANLDLIFLLKEGDSAIVTQRFDTTTRIANGLVKTDELKFGIRIKNLTNALDTRRNYQKGLLTKLEKSKMLKGVVRLNKKDSLNNIQLTPSGLKYILNNRGSGKTTAKGERTIINFVAILEDGKEFDSSWSRGVPFIFKVGQQEVIPGLDEAIITFPRGSSVTLIVPPQLAFKDKGVPQTIPPNATLYYYIDILN